MTELMMSLNELISSATGHHKHSTRVSIDERHVGSDRANAPLSSVLVCSVAAHAHKRKRNDYVVVSSAATARRIRPRSKAAGVEPTLVDGEGLDAGLEMRFDLVHLVAPVAQLVHQAVAARRTPRG
jgi:hypothetical protein